MSDDPRRKAPNPFDAAAEVLAPSAILNPRYRWDCDRPNCDGKPHEGAPIRHARANQLPPPPIIELVGQKGAKSRPWLTWLLLAGRGFGKSRVGSECAKAMAGYATLPNLWSMPESRGAIIVPDFSAGRDVCIEGDSGVLSVLPKELRKSHGFTWNRSLGELILPNGSRMKIYSSEDPEQLRGPQHHWIWADELAAWRYITETWDMAMMGLRLGMDPKCIISTTPKPLKLIKELMADAVGPEPSTVVTRGSTYDNLHNLAPTMRQAILKKYEGSRLGRQELYAEILEDADGALIQGHMIDSQRADNLGAVKTEMARIVVAIDPAITSGEESNETGIIVAGLGYDGRGYLLDDVSLRGKPEDWAKAAIKAYHRWKANSIVAEVNNGGDMVLYTLRTIDPTIPVKAVTATRGKMMRAEPVAMLYEQGKVTHVGYFAALEMQMTSWVPGMKLEGTDSPDRFDALVWALTDLMVTDAPVMVGAVRDRRLVGRR